MSAPKWNREDLYSMMGKTEMEYGVRDILNYCVREDLPLVAGMKVPKKEFSQMCFDGAFCLYDHGWVELDPVSEHVILKKELIERILKHFPGAPTATRAATRTCDGQHLRRLCAARDLR